MNVRTVYPRNSKIGDFQSKDKTKRFNNMYLPEETCSLSDTAKIGQEKNKIKFKYLNFCSLPNNTCFILRRKNVHAGLAQVVSYNISRYPNLNRIYDMPDKVFTEFGNLDGLRCGAGIPTLWLSVVSCGVSYPTRRVSKGELS